MGLLKNGIVKENVKKLGGQWLTNPNIKKWETRGKLDVPIFDHFLNNRVLSSSTVKFS